MEKRRIHSGKLLPKYEDIRKNKTVQFVSVASGVKKRLDINIERRRKSRRESFDESRAVPSANSAQPVKKKTSNDKKIQLAIWKEEKEKKKKEAMLGKKKPFIVGVVPKPIKFTLLPPLKANTHLKQYMTNFKRKHEIKDVSKIMGEKK